MCVCIYVYRIKEFIYCTLLYYLFFIVFLLYSFIANVCRRKNQTNSEISLNKNNKCLFSYLSISIYVYTYVCTYYVYVCKRVRLKFLFLHL